jgi:hypothetical protein
MNELIISGLIDHINIASIDYNIQNKFIIRTFNEDGEMVIKLFYIFFKRLFIKRKSFLKSNRTSWNKQIA